MATGLLAMDLREIASYEVVFQTPGVRWRSRTTINRFISTWQQ